MPKFEVDVTKTRNEERGTGNERSAVFFIKIQNGGREKTMSAESNFLEVSPHQLRADNHVFCYFYCVCTHGNLLYNLLGWITYIII